MNAGHVHLFIPTSRSGVARYAFELAVALHAGQSPKPVLVTPVDFEFREQLDRAGVKHMHVGSIGGRNTVTKIFSMISQIAGLVQHVRRARIQQSSVKVHLLATYVAPLQLFAHALLKLTGAEVFFTVHDVSPHYLSRSNALSTLNRWILRLSYSLVDRLHVHTEAQLGELVRDYSVSAKKISVIPHGLSLSASKRVAPRQRSVRLLAIGSIRANKKIVETVEALSKMRACPDEVRLAIYGSASLLERGYLSAVRKAVDDAGGRVTLHEGFVSEDQFDDLLQSHDAVLLPYGEFTSQSGVALRAIGNDCFVIGTPQAGGGLPIADTLGVAVAASATTDEIVAAIEAYISLDASERTARMGKLRALVAQQISWTVVSDSFSCWYQSV